MIFGVLCFFNDNISTFFPVYFPILLGLLATNSFIYDGQSNSERYMLSLPLSKKDIIRGKYIYIFTCNIAGAIIGIVLGIILQSIKNLAALNLESIISIGAGAVAGMTVMQSFQIPVIVKFGHEKGRVIQLICIGIILMLTTIVVDSNVLQNFPISLEKTMEFLEKYGVYVIIGIVSLLYGISYKVSSKLYSKKEV